MDVNFLGRLHNTTLSKNHVLYPLFEAVVNSIHSIEAFGNGAGQIKINILREQGQKDMNGRLVRTQVNGLEIEDDGIGFDELNYISFNTTDSRYKAHKGGRGVGRLCWLKAFEYVTIESVFEDYDSKKCRRFTFRPTENGVEDHSIVIADQNLPRKTKIRLVNLHPYYHNTMPKTAEIIANHVIEHCLAQYVLGKMPRILICDGENEYDLLKIYQNMVESTDIEDILIKEHSFKIMHFFLNSNAQSEHTFNFCADQRLVITQKVRAHISDLPSRFRKEGRSLTYVAYITSKYLDENVNSMRTEFYIPETSSGLIASELSWNNIQDEIISSSRKILEEWIEPQRQNKFNRIWDYVNKHAPAYRFILQEYKEKLDQIPVDVKEEDIETWLHKIKFNIDADLREDYEELIKNPTKFFNDEGDISEDTINAKYSELVKRINDFNKSELVNYVANRKRVLDILEVALGLNSSGKYRSEATIHRMIFPLRETSDSLRYEEQNLWIIDEGLTYHDYLASDIPLNANKRIHDGSADRPDIIIFNGPVAVSAEEPANGIVIIEFKKPHRVAYNDEEENPVNQVQGYIEQIREGKAKDRNGRILEIDKEKTPFYCYILCDLTSKIHKIARNFDFTEFPDRGGYFKYNKSYNAYIEIIGYTRLLKKAKQRNKMLFDKLGIPLR